MRIAWLLLLAAPLAWSQGSRVEHLSPALHGAADVAEAWFTPDGGHLCFVADLETDEADELWCAPVDDADAVQRIGGLLPAGSAVEQVSFSDDSATVYFVAPLLSAQRRELFAAPVDGGGPALRLGEVDVDGGAVVDYRIHAGAARVVYRADAEVVGRVDLYSAPLDGQGDPVRLNGALVAGGDVFSWRLADDGTTVVYRADQQTDNRAELYRVAITGGPQNKLSGPISVAGGSVSSIFELAGQHVVYRADPTVNDRMELFSAPLAGGPALALASPPVSGGNVGSFVVSPDGSRVAYLADDTVNQRGDLSTVPVDGSEPPVLLGAGVQVFDDNVLQSLFRFSWTADGTGLVSPHQQGTPGVDVWYFPALGGPGAVELDAGLSPARSPLHLPVSGLVLGQSAGSPDQLFCVAEDAPPPTELTAFVQSFTDIGLLDITAGGDRVALSADDQVDSRFRLFSAELPSGPLQAHGGGETSFRGLVLDPGTRPTFTPDVSGIWALERHFDGLFRSDRLRRYRLGGDGFRAAYSLSSLITQPDRRVEAMLPSPVDPDRIAVLSEGEADGRIDLYLVTVVDEVFANGFED